MLFWSNWFDVLLTTNRQWFEPRHVPFCIEAQKLLKLLQMRPRRLEHVIFVLKTKASDQMSCLALWQVLLFTLFVLQFCSFS